MFSSKKAGDKVKKGDHIGNFVFGGSSFTMVFQKKTKFHFSKELYGRKEGKLEGKQQRLNSFLAAID